MKKTFLGDQRQMKAPRTQRLAKVSHRSISKRLSNFTKGNPDFSDGYPEEDPENPQDRSKFPKGHRVSVKCHPNPPQGSFQPLEGHLRRSSRILDRFGNFKLLIAL